MTGEEFICTVGAPALKRKLKIVDKNGKWCDVGSDEVMPENVYGYAIYLKAEFPTSFIAKLQESGIIEDG